MTSSNSKKLAGFILSVVGLIVLELAVEVTADQMRLVLIPTAAKPYVGEEQVNRSAKTDFLSGSTVIKSRHL